ncbi:hypothetical protein [Rhodopirellula sp. P2]|uniref:hypothetical protein n=1 Tax=Rhodopirellula sp. P2 TaxID=2127060 RepID=UPI0023677A39|nr:hypothetical protein [Rhodopirellula sp. P2]WDQ18748.1 hypothetical protein PSR62_09425 [Rhodopirellula sp. P2]
MAKIEKVKLTIANLKFGELPLGERWVDQHGSNNWPPKRRILGLPTKILQFQIVN